MNQNKLNLSKSNNNYNVSPDKYRFAEKLLMKIIIPFAIIVMILLLGIVLIENVYINRFLCMAGPILPHMLSVISFICFALSVLSLLVAMIDYESKDFYVRSAIFFVVCIISYLCRNQLM